VWATVAALAALAAGGLGARYVWLAQYRPALREGETYGVDASHHQGRIDWRAVAHDGVAFAYVKATEGATLTDPRFAANVAGARAAGLRVGAYHFFSLCARGKAQAASFLSAVPVVHDALPPAVDLELAGNCAARPGREDVRRDLTAFLADLEERPLWRRHLVRRPRGDWLVWQVSGFARVHGIDGDVDLDVMRG